MKDPNYISKYDLDISGDCPHCKKHCSFILDYIEVSEEYSGCGCCGGSQTTIVWLNCSNCKKSLHT